MKTLFKLLFVGIILFASFQSTLNAATPAAQKKLLTQGDLAKRVAFISGLADTLPTPITGESAVMAMSDRGWAPIDGWRVGAIATKEDFFVVMAKYLGLKAKNPSDPKSYSDALVAAGFSFGDTQSKKSFTPKDLEERDRSISKLVIEVKGQAEFKDSAQGAWSKLGKLQPVKEGMSLRTSQGSYVDVVYAKGAAQRIGENSEILVEMLREEIVNGQAVRAVMIFISKGEAISIVDPMNKSSQFVMRDPFGKFEVDQAAGCQFSAKVADDQSITLNESDKILMQGIQAISPVQPRCLYVVNRGSGNCFAGAAFQRVNAGQQVILGGGGGSPITMNQGGGTGTGNGSKTDVNVAVLVEKIQRTFETLENKEWTQEGLTSAEFTALLGGFGAGPGNATTRPLTEIH